MKAVRSEQSINSTRPLHVVFVHLDLGIGGAEQLVLQLANASQQAGHELQILTTRCDPDHCFAAVKPGTGALYPYLKVVGRWIPAGILGGRAKAAFSALRLLFLALHVIMQKHHTPDVIVLDVLPLPLPFWQWMTTCSLLFYCHFPDQLLVQHKNQQRSLLKRLYRVAFNQLESICMLFADEIAVNSKFTRQKVLETFPALQATEDEALPVLYPALDTASMQSSESSSKKKTSKSERPLLCSLNRFERKKNLELVLHAVSWWKKKQIVAPKPNQLPRIVIAGGYDTQNRENVEYFQELQDLVKELKLEAMIEFRRSIPDSERAQLLNESRAVLYTPMNEHFGIVPVEVMYSRTVVICNASGGPLETVVHGETGFLCSEPTAEVWGKAMESVLQLSDAQLKEMGDYGKKRVEEHFSAERLSHEWTELLEETVVKGRKRLRQKLIPPKVVKHVLEALLKLLAFWTVAKLTLTVFHLLRAVVSLGGDTEQEL